VTVRDQVAEPPGAVGRLPTPAGPATSGVGAYRHLALRRAAVLAALLAALFGSVLADVVLGPSKLTVGHAPQTIVAPQAATAVPLYGGRPAAELEDMVRAHGFARTHVEPLMDAVLWVEAPERERYALHAWV